MELSKIIEKTQNEIYDFFTAEASFWDFNELKRNLSGCPEKFCKEDRDYVLESFERNGGVDECTIYS